MHFSCVEQKQELTVQVSLQINTTIMLEQVLTMDVDGGGRYFFLIKVLSEHSVFGVDLKLQCSSTRKKWDECVMAVHSITTN